MRIAISPPDESYDPAKLSEFLDENGVRDVDKPRHFWFHKTESLDYALVLEGEIYATMDEGETLMRVGAGRIAPAKIAEWRSFCWHLPKENPYEQSHHFLRHHRRRHTTSMSPYPPVMPEEISQQYIEGAAAGAAIIHLHARDTQTGRPSGDPAIFRRFVDIIKQEAEAVINISTGGGGLGMPIQERP